MRSDHTAAERTEGSRRKVLNSLVIKLHDANVAFEIRGLRTALRTWESGDSEDLDLWASAGAKSSVESIMLDLGFFPVAGGTSWRPNHVRWALDADAGPIVVEWMFGSITIAGLMLHAIDSRAHVGYTKAARVVDLTLRRWALGKRVEGSHLVEARGLWVELTPSDRESVLGGVVDALGGKTGDEMLSVMTQGCVPRRLPRRVRLAAIASALRSRRVYVSLRSRLTGLLRRGVLGQVPRGVLVVLVGTDGTGKSTTSWVLRDQLEGLGLKVVTRYFGRTRGNLPGIARARAAIEAKYEGEVKPGPRIQPTNLGLLRWVASWYYALEYSLRFWLTIKPHLMRGRIVLLDRYVYDLYIMPGASSRSAKAAGHLVARPHILLFLDAPAREVHERKPERTVSDIESHQSILLAVSREVRPAFVHTIVTTSMSGSTDLSRVASVIGMAAFRGELERGFARRAAATLLGI